MALREGLSCPFPASFYHPSVCCACAPQPPPLKTLRLFRGGMNWQAALAIMTLRKEDCPCYHFVAKGVTALCILRPVSPRAACAERRAALAINSSRKEGCLPQRDPICRSRGLRRKVCCPCYNHVREEGCPPLRASICRSRGFRRKVSRRELNCCQNSGGEGEGVRYADKPCGLSAHARTAVFAIGRAKNVTERGIYPRETNRTQNLWRTLGFPFPHDVLFHQFERKSVNVL